LCAARVEQAGGTAVLLSPEQGPPEALVGQVDALLIPGGGDVHPSLYGQDIAGAYVCGTPSVEDVFEIACIQEAYRAETPMLGICRGEQLMNVAAGGTLVQDLPSQWSGPAGPALLHRGPGHEIQVLPESKLVELVGASPLWVNTLHHQGVDRVGSCLKVAAIASDGVVEAVENATNPTQIGVQFHPEIMRDERTNRLFEYLVESGARFRTQRYNIDATCAEDP